jgi:DNA helicase HerA-like ATPase
MADPTGILIGKSSSTQQSIDLTLALRMANRHGLIAGATGTGKTISLQVLAEGFAKAGVPVFLADVKGDLSGISQIGGDSP